MYKEGIELYLSKDIIQGEEVPFYLIWERDDIKRVKLDFVGFSKIVEYHNLKKIISTKKRIINSEDLKSQGYFGGVLEANIYENPFQKAQLKTEFTLSNGEIIKLDEKRTLYSTNLEIKNIPDIIEYPFENPQLNIELKGAITVFIDLESIKGSDVIFQLPEDVQSALEKFTNAIMKGFENLKKEFPQYKTLFDLILEADEDFSERQFIEKFVREADKTKGDKDFVQAFTLVFVNALLSHTSIKDSFFRPLLEYFESNAAEKVFFESPFLCIKVPKGGGYLKGKIQYEDILQTEYNPVLFETYIKSGKEALIPIKKLIKIRRI